MQLAHASGNPIWKGRASTVATRPLTSNLWENPGGSLLLNWIASSLSGGYVCVWNLGYLQLGDHHFPSSSMAGGIPVLDSGDLAEIEAEILQHETTKCCVFFFPICQVRLVRFYQSCCPPPPPSPHPPPPPPVSPRPCLHQLPPPLPPCQLFAKLFANFRAQCALLDLNVGPSQLSAHRWTSTWDLPSSVRTAGPQPGTFPAQCAPLDLNLGPAELSAHRWTSTWDLPSSVRTAGPQKPDRMPEDMPDRMSDIMREDMPDKMPNKMP